MSCLRCCVSATMEALAGWCKASVCYLDQSWEPILHGPKSWQTLFVPWQDLHTFTYCPGLTKKPQNINSGTLLLLVHSVHSPTSSNWLQKQCWLSPVLLSSPVASSPQWATIQVFSPEKCYPSLLPFRRNNLLVFHSAPYHVKAQLWRLMLSVHFTWW